MPKTKVVFFKEDDGSVPILEWLDSLQPKALDKCTVRIERLKELGHELRRLEADFLRDGIYELRVGLHHVNYRMLSRFCTGDIIRANQTEFHNSRKQETRTNSLAKSMN